MSQCGPICAATYSSTAAIIGSIAVSPSSVLWLSTAICTMSVMRSSQFHIIAMKYYLYGNFAVDEEQHEWRVTAASAASRRVGRDHPSAARRDGTPAPRRS